MKKMVRPDKNRPLGVLADEKVEMLLSGLVTLEGALTALHQPLPPILEELKNDLYRARQDHIDYPLDTMSTRDAAALLNCTARHVRYLAKIGRIQVSEKGGVGRGRSNLYDVKSVEAYAAEKWNKEANK